MTKQILSAALASLMLVSAASFTASAADEKVYYVEQGESGGRGTEEKPFGSLEDAIDALKGKDGTIYVYGNYTIDDLSAPEWKGMVTVTGVTKDSAISLSDSQGATFNGAITFKDIGMNIGTNAHFNPNGYPLIIDIGEGNEFKSFMHLGVLGNGTVDEAYFELNSGYVVRTDVGGYATSLANGVAGDFTIVVNDGTLGTLTLRADSYMETMTGIAIGGNLNVIQNGGTIGAITTSEQTKPDILGALNFVFNNNIESPANFAYPEESASEGVYIVYSALGGEVMPTENPGVFTVKAEEGMIAEIDGKQYVDGEVTLQEGTTHVTWVEGVQASEAIEINLTIGDANMIVNGETTVLDVPAQTIDNRTMVPLRAIFEALGAEIEWNGETRTVSSVKGDTTVSLTVGENKITVNGEAKELDVPAQIKDNRTLVPVRAISEAFGCDVAWDGNTRTVTITK